MIDHPRAYEQNMCDMYLSSTSPEPVRLADFEVFKKGTFIYGNYYSNPTYDAYTEPEIENTTNVYHNLVTHREWNRDDWRYKVVVEWNHHDTISWLIETVQFAGISEYDVPFDNFRIPGIVLRGLKREDIIQKMLTPSVETLKSRQIADEVFNKLQIRLNEEMMRESSLFRYAEGDPYQHSEAVQVLDLDSLDHKHRFPSDYRPNDGNLLIAACDSSDDAEDAFPGSDTASPGYGSDRSLDDDDKRKQFKRPPGRPKGSGRKVCKRPRSVSVPEFLRNLLLDPDYCPSIIKWEDHSLGKFRFVKPDEVAKLWGKLKQNDNMTFEKFSRAMRYHYRQSVLVSVPSARLVYQFGHKGPDITTTNPNFSKVKSENIEQLTYS
ncbi:ETS-related transcription factor Elf-3-like [Plodia interpunctella]|uniref:ETS-related transcription factor Elf-3-like n=1 Tax=Plodia interpunctella TaxID=58824 RepID=UPI002368B3C9|nr:ETS-related transcription factor Elf-3-like [Plodia interpunctella]